MASTWVNSWGKAWGNVWGLITSQEPIQPSGGGFTYPLDRRYEHGHISKSVRAIIKRVAKKQVEEKIEKIDVDIENYTKQLMTALAKADIQYKAMYNKILEDERQQLIDAEIKSLMGLKRMRDEEEEVLAVLLALSY